MAAGDFYLKNEYFVDPLPLDNKIDPEKIRKILFEKINANEYINKITNEYIYQYDESIRKETPEQRRIRELEERANKAHRRVIAMEDEKLHEAKLRSQHPGLQEMWEQYQAMLKLVDVR